MIAPLTFEAPFDENFVTIDEIPVMPESESKTTAKPSIPAIQTSSKVAPAPVPAPAPSASFSEAASSSPPKSQQTEPAAPTTEKIRYDWYENSNSVNVSLFIKNAPKEKVTVDFTTSSVSVAFPLPTGSDFSYEFDPLTGLIDDKKSSFKVFGTKIELSLMKSVAGKWGKLLSETASNVQGDKAISNVTAEAAQEGLGVKPPAYPTSSKTGPKQWDIMFKDEVDELEKEETKDDPNAFFRTLFSQADPDTQRAMMKSYTESNGTALSTNWADVSQKTFETSPPDGMEAKLWNKN